MNKCKCDIIEYSRWKNFIFLVNYTHMQKEIIIKSDRKNYDNHGTCCVSWSSYNSCSVPKKKMMNLNKMNNYLLMFYYYKLQWNQNFCWDKLSKNNQLNIMYLKYVINFLDGIRKIIFLQELITNLQLFYF